MQLIGSHRNAHITYIFTLVQSIDVLQGHVCIPLALAIEMKALATGDNLTLAILLKHFIIMSAASN